MRANRWAIESIVDIKNSVEIFLFFRWTFTSYQCPVASIWRKNTTWQRKNIDWKIIWTLQRYQISRASFDAIFVGSKLIFCRNIQLSTGAITELYENLTIETLRGKRQPKFNKISDLISGINFTMQRSIMSNLENKDKVTVNSNEK